MFNGPSLSVGKVVAIAIIIIIAAALIFLAGMGFSSHRGHAGPGERGFSAFGVPLPNLFVMRGHGALGTITSSASSSITLKERDGNSEVVYLASSTKVDTPHGPGTLGDLAVGQSVIVIGRPNEAGETMQALFIKVVPSAQ